MYSIINGTDISVETTVDDIGTFHIAYSFECDDNRDIAQKIIDWLSDNCKDNFIVTETTRQIVAGGHSDNRQAWKRGLFDLKSQNNTQGAIFLTSFEVRLSKYDNTMFNMAWLDTKAK